MPKTAVMFGSIGSTAETSDIQRRAYNKALDEAGLHWKWDEATYAELLKQGGGKERLSHLAAATNVPLSQAQIQSIHQRKTEIACAEIAETKIGLRPGVADLIRLAKDRGMKLAFVTTTYRPNIDSIFVAAGNDFSAHDFDHIVSRDDVKNPKPAPDAYLAALKALGVDAKDALAIEDTAASVMSAKRAGIDVVATPGKITAGQDFWQADLVVDNLAAANGSLDKRILALLEKA